jgi:hypothetical protein
MALVVTDIEPTEFVAFTIALIEFPASSYVTLYVLVVAEFIVEQTFVALHRCHVYENVGAGNPPHKPLSTVISSPSLLNPEILGALVFVGAVGLTMGPNNELNLIVPPKLFMPVTCTRKYIFKSESTKVIDCPGCTERLAQLMTPDEVHFCHTEVKVAAGFATQEPGSN